MKNLYFKLMSYLIILFCIIIPIFSAIKSNMTTINMTIIPEEINAFSEINEETGTIQQFNMCIEFEEKIENLKTEGNLNNKPVSTNEIIEVQVIEVKTTKPIVIEQQKNSITTTQNTTNQELELEEETTILQIKENSVSSNKYPNAAIVWNYLRELGYNKAVCAGILGNMMAEVGGHTLELQPCIYAGNYYGLCMWYLPYAASHLNGANIHVQLQYLTNTIKSEINNFGFKYYNGFDYSQFLSITDPGSAAKAFAACYERCASWSYQIRIKNAYAAYDYFA